MWGQYDCYLSALRDVICLGLPEFEKFDAWERASIHGGFRIMHEEFCMVSDFPEFIRVDDQNRPHCATGPSHRWRDGWELFHWHGVPIPAAWTKGNFPTAKEMLHWENVEQRRAGCAMMGWARILNEIDAKVIDKNENPMIGTLIEADIPDSGKERFLIVKCGTGRDGIALPVPRHVNTAHEANASTWGYESPTQYNPEVRT